MKEKRKIWKMKREMKASDEELEKWNRGSEEKGDEGGEEKEKSVTDEECKDEIKIYRELKRDKKVNEGMEVKEKTI